MRRTRETRAALAETEGAAVPERLLITRTTGSGVEYVSLAGEVDLDGGG
ncbi:hypothetical protein SVIOM342S_08216 [Streptomyces violaceorubidus]